MYDDLISPTDAHNPKRFRHRPVDLIEDFSDDDLEAYAACAELAADHPDLDLVDLCELYGAADTAREAASLGRSRRGRLIAVPLDL